MSIVFIIRNPDTIYIIIIDLYIFRFGRENLDWTTNIVYLYCNEMIEEFDYLENYNYNCEEFDYLEDYNYNYESMDIDNYYSDQEYWFEGAD